MCFFLFLNLLKNPFLLFSKFVSAMMYFIATCCYFDHVRISQMSMLREDLKRKKERHALFWIVQWGDSLFNTPLLLIVFIYSAILRSRADSLRSHVILHECIAFYSAFLNIHWCHKNLLPERVNIGTFCVHHTTMHRVTSRKATCMCFTAQCISGVVFVCFMFL